MKVTLKTLLMMGVLLFGVAQAAYAPVDLGQADAPEIPSGLAPYFLAGLTGAAFLVRRFFNRKDG